MDVHNINMLLIRSNQSDTVITPRCESKRVRKEVILGYINEYHYVSSEPMNQIATTPPDDLTFIIEKFDDGDKSLHNLSEQELSAMDEIIVNVSTATICALLEQMKPLLMQVITGGRVNWRHNVVRRVNREYVSGHRVMSHHTNSISCNTGDFTNDSQQYVMNFAESSSVVGDFDYASKVLYQTIIEWLVIVLCDVNAPKARFYLNEAKLPMAI